MDQPIGSLTNLLEEIKLVLTPEWQLVDVSCGDPGPGHLATVAARAAISATQGGLLFISSVCFRNSVLPRSAWAMSRRKPRTLHWAGIQEGLVARCWGSPHWVLDNTQPLTHPDRFRFCCRLFCSRFPVKTVAVDRWLETRLIMWWFCRSSTGISICKNLNVVLLSETRYFLHIADMMHAPITLSWLLLVA